MQTITVLKLLTVLASVSLLGVGCTKATDNLPAGEMTSEGTSSTANTVAQEQSSNEPFVVDLVPGEEAPITAAEEEAAAENTEVKTTTPETASELQGTQESTSEQESTEGNAPAPSSPDLSDLIATPIDEGSSPKTSTDNTTATTQSEVQQLAETLTEIYGTYTNKDKVPFQNFEDLRPYTTVKFQQYLDSVSKGATQDKNAPFFGRTTTTLSSAVLQEKPASARILVTAKREDITGNSAAPATYFTVHRLEFVKKEGEWKLDGLYTLDLSEAQ